MPDREKVIKELEWQINVFTSYCTSDDRLLEAMKAALVMLKEQEKQKRKWLKNIADNQLANAPKDFAFGTLDEHLEREYNRGVMKGLQMAYEIISNDGERKNE